MNHAMTVFQEMAWIQLLILLTLWGFAIDTLVRRRRAAAAAVPERYRRKANPVLIYIVGGVAVFVVVIMFLSQVAN